MSKIILKSVAKELDTDLSDISNLKLNMIKNQQVIFKNFGDYNIYLVNHTIKITIKDYIECIHPHLFRNVDITLLEIFLNYSKDDTLFNIHINDIIKFKLIPDELNETIVKFISEYKLILDKDYRIRKTNNKNLSKNFQEYKFTSRCLKKCLMKLDIKYIDYYLLIENCIQHYGEYQNNLFHKLAFIKDIKLDYIIKNYEIQSENINILKENITNLNMNNAIMQDNINAVHQKIDNLLYNLEKENINDTESKINKFKKIIYTFSLYKIDKNKLYYLDTYKEIYDNIVKKNNLKYEQFELIYTIDYNAKYIDIISKLKNKYKDNLIFFNSEIILNNITSSIIIDYIKEEVKRFN